MKKKPYNDNLVMASIESLYNQANHSTPADRPGLTRQNLDCLPIIGSLPVTITSDTAEASSDNLDDMVLTGLLEAIPAEPTSPVDLSAAEDEPKDSPENKSEDKPKDNPGNDAEDNPFLAIRQAVISAGQTPPQPAGEALSDEPVNLAKQAFAGQLAELIDAEIERRLTERLNTRPKPAAGKTRKAKPKQAKTTPQAKQPGKAKKQQKTAAKAKQAKADKPAAKKTPKPRRGPKS